MSDNNGYMEMAIAEAKAAAAEGEIPVGAVVVVDDRVIAASHNNRENSGDATGHAEILAIREACKALGGWHLDSCTIYVTLEPCPMCMGAIVNSRIKKVVFGAKDAKAGACGSVMNMCSYPLNHKPKIESDFMKEECSELLSDFFKQRRN